MKVRNLKLISKIDPEDIKESKGDTERESKRIKLINNFVWWSWRQKSLWN
jgi:hypothetical protein